MSNRRFIFFYLDLEGVTVIRQKLVQLNSCLCCKRLSWNQNSETLWSSLTRGQLQVILDEITVVRQVFIPLFGFKTSVLSDSLQLCELLWVSNCQMYKIYASYKTSTWKLPHHKLHSVAWSILRDDVHNTNFRPDRSKSGPRAAPHRSCRRSMLDANTCHVPHVLQTRLFPHRVSSLDTEKLLKKFIEYTFLYFVLSFIASCKFRDLG